MNIGNGVLQMLIGKFMQSGQGRFTVLFQRVAIGDENHIFLGKIALFAVFLNGILFNDGRNSFQCKRSGLLPVYAVQQIFYLLHKASPFITCLLLHFYNFRNGLS